MFERTRQLIDSVCSLCTCFFFKFIKSQVEKRRRERLNRSLERLRTMLLQEPQQMVGHLRTAFGCHERHSRVSYCRNEMISMLPCRVGRNTEWRKLRYWSGQSSSSKALVVTKQDLKVAAEARNARSKTASQPACRQLLSSWDLEGRACGSEQRWMRLLPLALPIQTLNRLLSKRERTTASPPALCRTQSSSFRCWGKSIDKILRPLVLFVPSKLQNSRGFPQVSRSIRSKIRLTQRVKQANRPPPRISRPATPCGDPGPDGQKVMFSDSKTWLIWTPCTIHTSFVLISDNSWCWYLTTKPVNNVKTYFIHVLYVSRDSGLPVNGSYEVSLCGCFLSILLSQAHVQTAKGLSDLHCCSAEEQVHRWVALSQSRTPP